MIVSSRMRESWNAFRLGQRAKLTGKDISESPYVGQREKQILCGFSDHEMSVFQKSWIDGWNKPNKKQSEWLLTDTSF